ncbi:MAG: hypothetical protein M1831_001972 [Alyxoria varia]|nr:MAG: hypothetical protein M1831_001972 [Alyxoria varia]
MSPSSCKTACLALVLLLGPSCLASPMPQSDTTKQEGTWPTERQQQQTTADPNTAETTDSNTSTETTTDPAASSGGEKACTDFDSTNWCNANTEIFADDATFKAQIMNSTNYWRGVHQADSLDWDPALVQYAAENGVDACINSHTFDRGIDNNNGENLASNFNGPEPIVEAWVSEASEFNYENPVLNSAGHFQTIVWRDTERIGCARKWCGDDAPGTGWLVYCETNPRPLSFDPEVTKQNVKPPV